jgi:hypothetical protein|tara:strand:- start:41 stop:499 length:459 start_codon:yes stop_codon:yes gene_type:complete
MAARDSKVGFTSVISEAFDEAEKSTRRLHGLYQQLHAKIYGATDDKIANLMKKLEEQRKELEEQRKELKKEKLKNKNLRVALRTANARNDRHNWMLRTLLKPKFDCCVCMQELDTGLELTTNECWCKSLVCKTCKSKMSSCPTCRAPYSVAL